MNHENGEEVAEEILKSCKTMEDLDIKFRI